MNAEIGGIAMRELVRGMVEDLWTAMLPLIGAGDAESAGTMRRQFDARVTEAAGRLPPIEAIAFQQMIEAEEVKIAGEYP